MDRPPMPDTRRDPIVRTVPHPSDMNGNGDIFVSVETAMRNARRFQTSLLDEIRLYVVHGLLHLQGLDDTTPGKSRVMNSMQKRILSEVAKEH